jgi:selenocysteine lyase/cysteine desulfurase
MPKLDLDRIRHETRGCQERIHFNNAGCSLPSATVHDHLLSYLNDEERFGGYETAAARHRELEAFYDASARLLGCAPKEIAFIENATRAWDMVFYAIELGPGDRILTTVAEYGSNMIAYLHRARVTGCELVIIDNDEHGQLDVDRLEASIDDRVKLISISHIPTGGGLVNPAAAVGEVAKRHAIPYLLDACQSVGQMPIDVDAIGCDFLSGTGRKYLRGPRGTGLLYVRDEWIERLTPPLLDQFAADLISESDYVIRDDARRFENWERFFAGQAALGSAIHYACDLGLELIWSRIQHLAGSLRDQLSGLPGVEITDEGRERCGLVTFRHEQIASSQIKTELGKHGINVSVSSGSGSRVSFDRRGLDAVVRASVHYFNTNDEIERMIEALASVCER